MCDIICVTSRSLCRTDFLKRVEEIAECSPSGIILREKDLPEKEYMELAEQALKICERYQVKCILHSFVNAAAALGSDKIHLPMHLLRGLTEQERANFSVTGVSCHSVLEAVEAEKLGCDYIIAGHIFATGCKKGLAPRGVDFLKEVCESVSIPVYAIGGIDSGNIRSVLAAGAKGVCIMSGFMQCENPREYMKVLKDVAK